MNKFLVENEQMYSATVVLDSLNINSGSRLITMHLVLPWYITPELLRHRCMSFSSRSTRAVPAKRMIKQVSEKPCLPIHWGSNKPGMQAGDEVSEDIVYDAASRIHEHAGSAVQLVQSLDELGLHKQVVNKYLMPFLWCDILVTSSTYANFLALRTHEFAAPEMQLIARLMADAIVESEPQKLIPYEWHLPYVDLQECHTDTGWTTDDYGPQNASAARCARLSMRNFEDDKINWGKDIDLAQRLQISKPVHASPFEHVAQAMDRDYISNSNFQGGWRQYRKMLKNETERTFEWKGQIIR